MKLADAMKVLAAAAAYDNRTPSNDQATAWAYALGQHNITLDEAIRGVIGHFSGPAEEVDYLSPNHVIWNVKQERRRGLDHSSRLEMEMLTRLAATNPDDPGASIRAIQEARRLAAQDGTAVPPRPALPSRWENVEDRNARIRAGAARARAVLDEAAAKRQKPASEAADDGLTPAVRAARERAKTERRRRRSDPAPIGDVLGQIRRDR